MHHAGRLSETGRGVAYSNLAVILFGLAGVLGKLTGLPSPLIVLGRVVFAGIGLAAVVRWRKLPTGIRRWRDVAVLVGPGLLLAVHWTAFFQSISVSNVAIGLLSYSSFPLFTAFVEPLLLGQPSNRFQTTGSVVILIGVYLLVPSFTLDDSVTQGVVWGLVAGATFALLSVINRRLRQAYTSLTISLMQDGVAAIVLLPTLVLSHPASPVGLREIVILAVLGIACTAVAHTLFIEGLSHISAQLASLSGSLEPIWGILFALLILGEFPSGRTLLGGAIILGATILPTAVALRHQVGQGSATEAV